MKVCPVCNKRFRYRNIKSHLLCQKKLIEFEETKSTMKHLFETQGIHVLDLY